MKTAVLQVADTGPLDSLVEMLQSVGYRCYLCGDNLRRSLKDLGCDTVLANADLVRNEGYEPPSFDLGEATPEDMYSADLYVDVKAHRNCPKVLEGWPNLRGKVLWYRINGGKPEHVVNSRGDMGDEVNPPCSVLTPNQWYKRRGGYTFQNVWDGGAHSRCVDCGGGISTARDMINHRCPWECIASYACWPPFVRSEDYSFPRPFDPDHVARKEHTNDRYTSPICLVHNFAGWGYGAVLDVAREFGVRVHGLRSPDGLLQHREVRVQLEKCLAYVHLKSSDAPGYALYEALAARCPVVCTRRLLWKNRMEDLLIPGETCYVFDRPTHDPICPEEVAEIRAELGAALKALSSPQENRRIGENGRKKLAELAWSKDRPEDVASLREFFARNFGG